MRVITTFCDVCDNVCADGDANQASIKWVNGDTLTVHVCKACKEDIYTHVTPSSVYGYQDHMKKETNFFKTLLKAIRLK